MKPIIRWLESEERFFGLTIDERANVLALLHLYNLQHEWMLP
jgi:hypothetical protein